MSKLWNHLRTLWPRYTLLPGLPLLLWAAFMACLGLFRIDHLVIALVVVFAAYYSRRTKSFFLSFLGFVGVAWFYDAMRFFKDLGLSVDRVALCNLRELERSLFGFTYEGQRITFQDYFYTHHNIIADVYFAIPYCIFIYVAMGYGVYLFVKDPRACQRYSWSFFVLNIAGFVTYHVLPAAPPWYFHKFGCAVDLAAHSSEGAALARVDALLHMSYFNAFYGRASEVYGAIPSLHVAYPLLIAYEGWRRHSKALRALIVLYCASMCVAAVYLDHHWIIDILCGWTYTLVVILIMRRVIPVEKAVPCSDPAVLSQDVAA